MCCLSWLFVILLNFVSCFFPSFWLFLDLFIFGFFFLGVEVLWVVRCFLVFMFELRFFCCGFGVCCCAHARFFIICGWVLFLGFVVSWGR